MDFQGKDAVADLVQFWRVELRLFGLGRGGEYCCLESTWV